jgi:predicted Zn-ribbon and HTH transcriptional regulator
MKSVKCPKCDYQWTARVESPRMCPLCKSYLQTKKKKNEVQSK